MLLLIEVIAFDGDDTLWHNERIFSMTQDRYRELLGSYSDGGSIQERLLAAEMRNLRLFGYGVKGFSLSMIETAIEVSKQHVPATTVQAIIDFGKEMLAHPVELLDGAREVLEHLSRDYRLMLITKGDLFDQESKLARSGLAELFWRIEIVSEKDESVYRRIMRTHNIAPDRFLMVGNSIRSDILPVVAAGGRAVHVPYHVTWVHEQADLPEKLQGQVDVVNSLSELPGLLPATPPGSDVPTNIAQEVIQLLVAMSGQLSQHFSALAAEFSLSPGEGKVLLSLQPGEILPMRTLARRLGLDASNLTGIVDRLEDRGTLERRADPADCRVEAIAITERGIKLREGFSTRLTADAEPVKSLTAFQLIEFRKLLELAMKD